MTYSTAPWYTRNYKIEGSLLPKQNLYEINQAYYDGHHFKAGNNLFWIGALPDFTGHREYHYMLNKVEKLFTSHNKIKECIDRYIESLFSNDITFTHRDKETQDFLNAWQNELVEESFTANTDEVEDAYTVAVRNALVLGEGYIRVYVRDEFKDPLKKISAHSPHPSRIRSFYSPGGVLEAIEYQMIGGNTIGEETKFERQVLDFSTGITTFYLYSSEEKFEAGEFLEPPYSLDLNYSFTIHKLSIPSLVTDSVKRLQNAINLCLTMSVSNTIDAGFLERIILNAQLPGQIEIDAQGRQSFVPDIDAFKTGTGIVNFLAGIPIEDSEGNVTGFSNPSVDYKPPVDNKPIMEAIEKYSKFIYLELNQGHVLASDSGDMSGESRVQLKQDYEKAVKKLSRGYKALAKAVSKTVAILHKLTSGQSPSDTIRDSMNLGIEYSIETSLLPTEIQQVRDNYVNKVVSHRTTLIHLGFTDPDLELEQIAKEREQEMEMMQRAAIEEVPEVPFSSSDTE